MFKQTRKTITALTNRTSHAGIRSKIHTVGLWSFFLCFALFVGSITVLPLLAPDQEYGERDATVSGPPVDKTARSAIVDADTSQDARTHEHGLHNPDDLSAPPQGQSDEQPLPPGNPTMRDNEGANDPTTGVQPVDPVDPNRLAENIDPEHVNAWQDFQHRHPGVDPTDYEQFHMALIDEREKLPVKMSFEQRETYGKWLAQSEQMRDAMIRERARIMDIPVEGITHDDRDFMLTGFDGPEPVYTYSENHRAAISIATSFVRRNTTFDAVFGEEIDGSGFFANINDSGIIGDHTEFRNDDDSAWRTTIVRGTETGSGHGTRVAGTFGARGVDPDALGMAPAVHLYSFRQQQQADVINYGMDWPGRPERSIIGNTSLGTDRGDLNGLYTSISASFDSALHDTPYYLHFYSAGNEGPGFITLSTTRKDAKNLFAVAGVTTISRNSEGERISGGNLRNSSSWGPTRDGRIKPDIAADGTSVYTSDVSTDGVLGYSRRSGTSYSAPNASGSALLLQDYFSKRFKGNLMRASTLMALIINTAEDFGHPGPDYKFGWGLMNTLEAARLVQRHADNPNARLMREERLHDSHIHNFSYQSTGEEPLRTTLVWTDPPGPARTESSEIDPVLVNDLNLMAISPSGTTNHVFVMPYVVGNDSLPPFHPDLLDEPAVTGMNFTDNKIMVLVNDPEPGIWDIEISHTGSLHGDTQMYALVVDGLESALPADPPTITGHTEGGDPDQDFSFVEVEGSGFILGATLWFYRGGYDPVSAYAVETTSTNLRARLDHSTMDEGSWILAIQNPDGLKTFSPQHYTVGEPSQMPPPHITSISVTEGTNVTLEIDGFGVFSVQGTTTLLDTNTWMTLDTHVAPVHFTETNAYSLFTNRFYRLKSY